MSSRKVIEAVLEDRQQSSIRYRVSVGALRQSCVFCILGKQVKQKLEMSLAMDLF